jgi:hypothetical protein
MVKLDNHHLRCKKKIKETYVESINKIECQYKIQINELQENLKKSNQVIEASKTQYQELLVKHNSSQKNHRYVKFKESGPCFYIIEHGISCECSTQNRFKFGIAGTSKINKDSLDKRLQCHRTTIPRLRVIFVVF